MAICLTIDDFFVICFNLRHMCNLKNALKFRQNTVSHTYIDCDSPDDWAWDLFLHYVNILFTS